MKIIDSKSLGETIRERRKELNYTQAFLADFTGLSVTFVSDVERGKTTAEIGKVIQLLNTLGLDILIEKRG
jgi:y4mF family transcriptional regulator